MEPLELSESEKEKIRFKIQRMQEEPSFPGMLDFVHTLDACVVHSASIAGIKSEELPLLRGAALQNVFLICFTQAPREAVNQLYTYVSAITHTITHRVEVPPIFYTASPHTFVIQTTDASTFQECHAMYSLAVSTVVSEGIASKEGQNILRKLMASLSLSFDDLGRMFGVSGETVRRWESGAHPIPIDRNSAITLSQTPLNKLLEIFRPTRLPQVIRRRSNLFNGERALDWILRGKIADVADQYEIALRYQA
jgi:hypothetical protein